MSDGRTGPPCAAAAAAAAAADGFRTTLPAGREGHAIAGTAF